MTVTVLFLSKSYPVYGGVERWISTLCEDFTGYGIDPIVALAKGLEFNDPIAYQRAHPNLQTLVIDGSTGSREGCRYAVKKTIKLVKPDIVVPVMLHDGLVGAVRIKERGQQLKIVYPVHEHHPGIVQDLVNYGSYIDMVVCSDWLMRNVLVELTDIPKERILVINVGIKLPKVLRKKSQDSKITIGFAGRLQQKQKRIFDIERLCDELDHSEQSYSILIAGSGTDELRLRERLKKWEIDCRVKFMGQLSLEEMYQHFYPQIDILLITSEWETGPIVAWEAMAHGVTIVTSRYRGLEPAGFYEHEQNSMIYEVGDMIGANKAIQRLAHNLEFRKKISEQGKKKAIRERSVQSMLDAWAHLLKDISEKPPIMGKHLKTSERKYKSRLEKFLISIPLVEFIRRTIGIKYLHESGRSEWPFFSLADDQQKCDFENALLSLDKRGRFLKVS